MRTQLRAQSYVCLPCQIRTSRRAIATEPLRLITYSRRAFASNRIVSEPESELIERSYPTSSQDVDKETEQSLRTLQETKQHSEGGEIDNSDGQAGQAARDITFRRVAARASPNGPSPAFIEGVTSSRSRKFTTTTNTSIELSEGQQNHLREANALVRRLNAGLNNVEAIKKNPSIGQGLRIDQLLKTLPQDGQSPIQRKIVERLGTQFSGQSFGAVTRDVDLATTYSDPSRRTVTDPKDQAILAKLGVFESSQQQAHVYKPFVDDEASKIATGTASRRKPLSPLIASQVPEKRREPTSGSRKRATAAPWTTSNVRSIQAEELSMQSLENVNKIDLPQLSFDLSRVLFNPGCVYQLQDPRSRVYNFDPYLEKIMPVKEFNFEALNPYLTSSEDKQLIALAQEHGKRYIGSSSSMTSVLAHFHFLISQWRELNVDNLSRGFVEPSRSFTTLGKSPAAIFLRYKDGVYAVDADKEFDEPNILMSLGKSMEKLLTLEKEDFEKWRRSNIDSTGGSSLEEKPESFHYAVQGRFLLRSQLDAYDPRLPGKGFFDLKTRAVAAIRFNIRETEAGVGYQIHQRQGSWETYEREYYDMMRSTFLKYSLQARMGHMDGIFVAYHNTARIFGFQYIPMSEMDFALHGQTDTCLGDQEFRFSINLMEELFNLGTEKYPKQSLRIHFHTRESSPTEERPYMNIFIEPMAEDDVKEIQESQKAQFEAFERKMLRGEDPAPLFETEAESANEDGEFENAGKGEHNMALPINSGLSDPTSSDPSAANTAYLDSILDSPQARVKPASTDKEVMAFKLVVQNKINDRPVSRVEDINSAARWSIDYKLERRSDEEGKRMYRICKNFRSGALKTVVNRSSNDPFIRSMRAMAERGAEWRKQQDELDAQRERVVLYEDRL